jgi:hypothetical protein
MLAPAQVKILGKISAKTINICSCMANNQCYMEIFKTALPCEYYDAHQIASSVTLLNSLLL